MNNAEIRIAILGSGGVASSLAPALDSADGVSVVQVYSPTLAHAKALASRLRDAETTDDCSQITRRADIYLISVKDDAIGPLVDKIAPNPSAIWAHTSGSVEAKALERLSPRYGVFYPLQTFNRDRKVELTAVPLFIEGSDAETTAGLVTLANKISREVHIADSATRKQMHIAAVFACNFTNHLWAIADEILAKEGLSINILQPLLRETLLKAMSAPPAEGQTGPARRGDSRVMNDHISMLDPQKAEIYKLLSNSILRKYDSL